MFREILMAAAQRSRASPYSSVTLDACPDMRDVFVYIRKAVPAVVVGYSVHNIPSN